MEISEEDLTKILEDMPLLDYSALYSEGQAEYFTSAGQSLEDLDDLSVFTDKLKQIQNVVLELTSEQVMSLNYIVRGIHIKENQKNVDCWWDLEPEILTANEALFMICYPFWHRMGGSWEVRFALSGKLGKYLKIYKEKIEQSK